MVHGEPAYTNVEIRVTSVENTVTSYQKPDIQSQASGINWIWSINTALAQISQVDFYIGVTGLGQGGTICGTWPSSGMAGMAGVAVCELSFIVDVSPSPLPLPSPSPSFLPSPSLAPLPSPSFSPQLSLVCSDLIRDPDASLDIGDSVVFTCSHQLENVVFDHYDYRFKIDSGQWQNPSGWQGLIGDTPSYTINQEGTYTVQCRVCSSADSNNCTTWGYAGGWTQ